MRETATMRDSSPGELAERIKADLSNADPLWWSERRQDADHLRVQAISASDPQAADRAWFLMAVCDARRLMASSYANIMARDYRSAWEKLERTELACADLLKNPFLDLDTFEVCRLERLVERWQALFPYRLFMSPEMIIREERCSICQRVRSPFTDCDHKLGKVYGGVMCNARVEKLDFRGVSLVTDPVQKFSVLIPDPDPFDYDQVRFVADRVSGPFANWDRREALAYHAHALFTDWPIDGVCPCQSGRFYKDCCLPLPGVVLPHISIIFDEPTPPGLSTAFVSLPHPSDAES